MVLEFNLHRRLIGLNFWLKPVFLKNSYSSGEYKNHIWSVSPFSPGNKNFQISANSLFQLMLTFEILAIHVI